MKTLIKEIYRLSETAVLTPHNLLDNVTLDNYCYVNYSLVNNEIVCNMASIEENEEVKYTYTFSKANKLNKASIFYGDKSIEIFNRHKELDVVINEYENDKLKEQRISS